MKMTALTAVRAMQYLYYTGDGNNRLKGSPVSDLYYDRFCDKHGIDGNGGSDCVDHYTAEEVKAAELIAKIKTIPIVIDERKQGEPYSSPG